MADSPDGSNQSLSASRGSGIEKQPMATLQVVVNDALVEALKLGLLGYADVYGWAPSGEAFTSLAEDLPAAVRLFGPDTPPHLHVLMAKAMRNWTRSFGKPDGFAEICFDAVPFTELTLHLTVDVMSPPFIEYLRALGIPEQELLVLLEPPSEEVIMITDGLADELEGGSRRPPPPLPTKGADTAPADEGGG